MRIGILLCALFICTACISDPPLKVRGDTRAAATDDGWPVALPEDEGLDSERLESAYDLFFSDAPYYNAISLLIARDGRLVGEAYARGPADRTVKRNVQSATKSVTSLVFGVAVGDGSFPDLDRTLYSIIPEAFDSDPRKRDITLRHLLTMRSGVAFANGDFSEEMLMDRPRDQARRILAKPLHALPGEQFDYRDADPQLLASAVERVTGRQVAQIAAERLFGPLGISDWYWEANADGTTIGGAALFLRPRDLAKLGQLVLQEGTWNGAELVPPAWLRAATAEQSTTTDPATPYGYYWWLVPELGAYTAWGHGGNFIFIASAQRLVIVMTSLPSADDDNVGTVLSEFIPLARLIVSAAQ
jgi:CubicO group peptidase (beta-lactamase class C family)